MVANPHPERQDEILVVFPLTPHELPASIDKVKSGAFQVAMINWPTFRLQFEIDDGPA